jgi:hypothetical protein
MTDSRAALRRFGGLVRRLPVFRWPCLGAAGVPYADKRPSPAAATTGDAPGLALHGRQGLRIIDSRRRSS